MTKKTKKGTEEKLSELHGLVADKITSMVKSAEPTDFKALELALRFLKDNNIKADMETSDMLEKLEEAMNNKVNINTLPFPTNKVN